MADISKRLDKAEKLLQRGKTEAALEEYLGILDEEPKNDHVRQTAADLCLALGRGSEAATLLSSIFEQEVEAGENAKGIVTFKKLSKISVPTPLQTFHYAQLVEKKDKREALEAYETALAGFEKQKKNTQALAAIKRIVELSPTAENHERVGEKAALLGEAQLAAANFVRLGQLKDEESPGTGFPCYERAYKLDPMDLQAVLLYSRGLFSRNQLGACIDVLIPVVTLFHSTPELRELYAHAMMAAHRPAEAEPHAWELFVKDPRQLEEIASLVGVYLDMGDTRGALNLAHKIEDHETRAGRRREFVTAMFEMSDRRQSTLEFSEYMEKLFSNAGREHEYNRILLQLFQLYCDANRFREAAETLDRAAELDPYESGHAKRLEKLRGRIDENLYNRVANRFQKVDSGRAQAVVSAPAAPAAVSRSAPAAVSAEVEPQVLEDFILQAELYMQYGMRSKAMECIQRMNKLYPHEEEKSEKLRLLYVSAGFNPPYGKKAAQLLLREQPPTARLRLRRNKRI
jgi:tetratricopeptide (TPR) repeat protein